MSDVDLRRQLEMRDTESQMRRARLRCAASLIRVVQPSVATLLGVGRKASADWARMLLVKFESLRAVCSLFRNLGDPSIDGERWLETERCGSVRPHETNWREAHYISTVDLLSTFPVELPPDTLLCPECPHECVRDRTTEPEPMDTEQWRETS